MVTLARGSTDKRLPLALTPLTEMNSFKLNLCSPKSLAVHLMTGAPWSVKSSMLDPSDSPMKLHGLARILCMKPFDINGLFFAVPVNHRQWTV